VAAELQKEQGLEVNLNKGGLGQLTVEVDGREVFDSPRWWYATPGGVLKKVRNFLVLTD